MSEVTEDYKFLNEIKKQEKARNNTQNRKIINDWIGESPESRQFVTYKENVILFRFSLWPWVDFYPTTNKWRSFNRTFHGDANDLLEWLDTRKRG